MRTAFNLVDGEAKAEKDNLFHTRINGKILMRVWTRFGWVRVRISDML
jgi:hypothetical protein